MAKEVAELSRSNALLVAEVQLLNTELERVTKTPSPKPNTLKHKPIHQVSSSKPTSALKGNVRTENKTSKKVPSKIIDMTPTTPPSPPSPWLHYDERMSTRAPIDSQDFSKCAKVADRSCSSSPEANLDFVISEADNSVEGIIAKERRARQHAEKIATRAISLAMNLVNESNMNTRNNSNMIIESSSINKTPLGKEISNDPCSPYMSLSRHLQSSVKSQPQRLNLAGSNVRINANEINSLHHHAACLMAENLHDRQKYD